MICGLNCDLISGCSTINSSGIDDSEYFYDYEYYCIQECTMHTSNYGDNSSKQGNDAGVMPEGSSEVEEDMDELPW